MEWIKEEPLKKKSKKLIEMTGCELRCHKYLVNTCCSGTAWAETCMCAQLLCAHMYICVYTCTHVCACTNYTPTWTLKETQYKYVRDLPNCLVQTSYQQYMMEMECTSGFCLKASQCFKQSETQTFLCPGKRTPIGMGSVVLVLLFNFQYGFCMGKCWAWRLRVCMAALAPGKIPCG